VVRRVRAGGDAGVTVDLVELVAEQRALVGGLQDHAIAGGECGRELPARHQDGEVPRDDLTDHAERLVIVIGDRVLIELAERAFLRADARREVAEVIDGKRNVRGACLADRLAVVDGLDRGDELQILRHAVGDLVEERGALGRRRIAPGVLRLMGGVERKLDPGPSADTPYATQAETLPATLGEALEHLRANEVLRAGLGAGFVDYFCHIKQAEIARFNLEVTDWEQREYFELY